MINVDNFGQYYVAIGASAGGLEAIHELFDNMPADTGFSFFLIQHLSPDHKSLMAELLAKHTSMKVLEAQENMNIESNAVYVIPSKKMMSVKAGKLHLIEKLNRQGPNTAIDIFLESLAEDKKNEAIAIILSGTGTDGTKGIEAIKAANGAVYVQDPATAAFDGMPNSAIATGLVDGILAPAQMPSEIIEYIKEVPAMSRLYPIQPKDENLVNEILSLIKTVAGYDFFNYKRATIDRRLVKRMNEKGATSLAAYLTTLHENHEEVKLLSKDFLIGVTAFFRDDEAYDLLNNKVLPQLFTDKVETIKIWSVACSTGQEAYSLAMLFSEYMETNKIYNVAVKIFATDIDTHSLSIASQGDYPLSIANEVSEDRLKKFFIKEGNVYRINAHLRKMIVFAHHNILKDPPFSRLDLVCCRNMLIYMNPLLQKTALKSFHFALNKGGFLLLGPSENIGYLKEWMEEIDKKWKLFRCTVKTNLLDNDLFVSGDKKTLVPFGNLPKSKKANAIINDIFKETITEQYNYAGILIDREFEIKQATGNYKNFLRFEDNFLAFNLLKVVETELSIALSTAVRNAITHNEKVMSKAKVFLEEGAKIVSITIKPYLQNEFSQPLLFVLLYEESKELRPLSVLKEINPKEYTLEKLNELEKELFETRENLQAVIEEAESANEELQSSNEEIISTNEELQSSNEELQSLNEELHTVNAEHQAKIKELIELNDDMNNYFSNSDIGQILIDQHMIIRKFSPAATRQINLIGSDIGRSINDITNNFIQLDFTSEIKTVVKSSKAIEREVALQDGKIMLMKIMPYVKQDGKMDGAVISFVDITETKRLNSFIEGILNSSLNGIVALKVVKNDDDKIVDFKWMALNIAAENLLAVAPNYLVGKSYLEQYGKSSYAYFEVMKNVVETGENTQFEYYSHENNKWLDIVAVKMDDGIVMTFTDITDKKKSADLLHQGYQNLKVTSEKLEMSNMELERSNLDLVQFASVASHDLKEPLRKIQVFGNMLMDGAQHLLAREHKIYLEKIISSSSRMKQLIEDVLMYSKLSNKEGQLTEVHLKDTIERILEDYELTIHEKHAVIEVNDFPPIIAMEGQMRQLFQNLISNGLKFNESPAPLITITHQPITEALATEYHIQPDQFICIAIKDNGIGFEEQYKDKIFGLFQRLHNSSTYQGTGIGLAICKKIIDNHNGIISVASELGKGTSFTIFLPTNL